MTLESVGLVVVYFLSVLINIDYIKDKFSELPYNYSLIKDIRESLIDFEKVCENEGVKNVLSVVMKILDFSQNSETQLETETIEAIQQSIEQCSEVLSDNINIDLIIFCFFCFYF